MHVPLSVYKTLFYQFKPQISHFFLNNCANVCLHSALSRVVNHQAVQDFLDKQVLNHNFVLPVLRLGDPLIISFRELRKIVKF